MEVSEAVKILEAAAKHAHPRVAEAITLLITKYTYLHSECNRALDKADNAVDSDDLFKALEIVLEALHE